MKDHTPWFHAVRGVYFARRQDGAVLIGTGTSHTTVGADYHVIDADTWASAVAHVSAVGEDATTFAAAKALHNPDE